MLQGSLANCFSGLDQRGCFADKVAHSSTEYVAKSKKRAKLGDAGWLFQLFDFVYGLSSYF